MPCHSIAVEPVSLRAPAPIGVWHSPIPVPCYPSSFEFECVFALVGGHRLRVVYGGFRCSNDLRACVQQGNFLGDLHIQDVRKKLQ